MSKGPASSGRFLLQRLVAAGLVAALVGAAYGQRIVFSDDMTNFPAGWTLGTNGFNPDTWTRKTNLWFSAPAAAKCTRNDTHYLDSTNHWMQRPISLRRDSMGVATFRLWQATEQDFDFIYLEYSTDGGLNWIALWQSSEWHDWDQVVVPGIPSNANAIRFRFYSDVSVWDDGVYIDDVVLYSVDSAQTLVWYDDMTNFPANWSLSGNDTWGPQSYHAHSPAIAAQCSGVDSGYKDYQDNRADRAINLTHPTSAFLSYWLYLRAEEDYDYLYSELYSPWVWEELASHTGYFGWTHFVCDLSRDYEFVDSIGFHFCSDLSNTDAGAFVDDVTVTDFTRMGIDLAAVDIVNPPLDVDSGALVLISARIRNNSVQSVATPVYFEVYGVNYRVMAVTGEIPPGETALVNFPGWEADVPPGEYRYQCWLARFADTCEGNDAAQGSIAIANRDAAAMQILAPVGHVGPGAVVPQAIVRNHGSVRAPVDVTFHITDVGYSQTVHLANGLPVRTDTTIQFPSWTVLIGQHSTRCSTAMAGDQIPRNNRILDGFDAGQNDVSATQIAAPQGRFDTSAAVAPSAVVRNLGLRAVSFDVGFWICDSTGTEVYFRKSTVTNLGVGASRTVTFDTWPKPHLPGRYMTRCSTSLADDWNPANDATRDSFTLSGRPGWGQCASLPAGGKRRNVKDGGCLAWGKGATDANDTGYVYAFKGNGTYEFYRYNTVTNVWVARDSIPAIGHMGKKKAVKKGAALVVGTDGKAYGTKGNNTYEFWCYDPARSAGLHWAQLTDVPRGTKALKEGTGLAAVRVSGTDYIYALKGSGTYEFYRYRISDGSWETMASAPNGISNKPYKYGSCLAYDGGDTIYCLKGSYNELFAYCVSGKSWATKDTMPKRAPLVTKKTKVKDGAGMAFYSKAVYALKGGNTDEFWMFSCSDQQWHVQTQLTAGSKRVKGGGALAIAKDIGALYAFRGNNTLELWRYGPIASFEFAPVIGNEVKNETQGQSSVRGSQFVLRIAPNPFTSSLSPSISYSLPRTGNISLRLYDVAGKLMTTLARGYTLAGSHTARLNVDKLARGVYLLRYEYEGNNTATCRLIIE
jgi:hypothetical protein